MKVPRFESGGLRHYFIKDPFPGKKEKENTQLTLYKYIQCFLLKQLKIHRKR
jgi:hypothetical protein